jgi:DMSO reductase family type II enzyme heme b subunit
MSTSTDLVCCLVALTLLAHLAGGPAAAQVEVEPVPPTPVAVDAARGLQLYQRHCAQCHGAEGKGDGVAADLVYPRPRDFTTAIFKVRSTKSGQLPTDHDLFRVISDGLPGTSMPAWRKYLTEAERWQLVHHVKSLDSLGLFKDEAPKEQVRIGTPRKPTEAIVARGRELYDSKKCWQCHGKVGRGDGPSAIGLKDEWGDAIRPVNFTKGWRFRAGDRIEDIYRTFTTGFNGTPMPSFADAIPEAEDRWALAAYVKSLTRSMQTGEVIVARRLDGALPADPFDPAWDRTALIDVPLAGQIIVEPRHFKPAHDVVTVRALYTDSELALLIEWDDGTHNRGADGKPADQAAVQLPARPSREEKPYFLLGDRANAVDYWRWSAGRGLERFLAAGADRMEPRPAGSLTARGAYRDGQYRVLLRRPLKAAGANEPELAPGQFMPVAFHLSDGGEGESGLKTAISAWTYLLLEPSVSSATLLWPLALGLLTAAGEAWLVRRRRLKRTEAAT